MAWVAGTGASKLPPPVAIAVADTPCASVPPTFVTVSVTGTTWFTVATGGSARLAASEAGSANVTGPAATGAETTTAAVFASAPEAVAVNPNYTKARIEKEAEKEKRLQGSAMVAPKKIVPMIAASVAQRIS